MNASSSVVVASSSAPPPPKRRAAWRWIAALAILATGLLVVAALAAWAADAADWPLRIVIDGDEVWNGDLGVAGLGHPAALAAGLLVAFVAVALVVPAALALALLAAAVGLVAGFGLPLLLVLVVTAFALSPLVVIGLAVAWLWRRLSRPAARQVRTP